MGNENSVRISGKVMFTKDAFFIDEGKAVRVLPPDSKFVAGVILGIHDHEVSPPITKVIVEDALSSLGWCMYDRVSQFFGEEKAKEFIEFVSSKVKEDANKKHLQVVGNEQANNPT